MREALFFLSVLLRPAPTARVAAATAAPPRPQLTRPPLSSLSAPPPTSARRRPPPLSVHTAHPPLSSLRSPRSALSKLSPPSSLPAPLCTCARRNTKSAAPLGPSSGPRAHLLARLGGDGLHVVVVLLVPHVRVVLHAVPGVPRGKLVRVRRVLRPPVLPLRRVRVDVLQSPTSAVSHRRRHRSAARASARQSSVGDELCNNRLRYVGRQRADDPAFRSDARSVRCLRSSLSLSASFSEAAPAPRDFPDSPFGPQPRPSDLRPHLDVRVENAKPATSAQTSRVDTSFAATDPRSPFAPGGRVLKLVLH